VIVVVVIPLMVVETSLTMVLDELPPLDPELPPADCDDEVADVDDVDDADVDDVDVANEADDFADDDVAACDEVAVIAAVEEAIALIDMKTLRGRAHGCGIDRARFSPSTQRMQETGATNSQLRSRFGLASLATNHRAQRYMFLLSANGSRKYLARLCSCERTVISFHIGVSWSSAG